MVMLLIFVNCYTSCEQFEGKNVVCHDFQLVNRIAPKTIVGFVLIAKELKLFYILIGSLFTF